MTKAEELAIKEELSEDDWNYIMTMGHGEYRDYSLAVSKDRGYINHLRETEMVELKLSKADIKAIVHCINTNATLESHIKEELLVNIRKFIDVS